MATKQNAANQHVEEKEDAKIESLSIGYIMPIAKTDGYPESHWLDVKQILDDTVNDIGINDARIVSDGGEITTIHSRIVNNLYSNDIVICDVSSRNPNVMFELGMRIAFDKPVIIIKDEVTNYCFDSGTIEHLSYPKDLRHGLINDFKIMLSNKIKATFDKYLKNKDDKISPILKNFGSFDKGDVKIDALSANEALIQDIRSIKEALVKIQMTSSFSESISKRERLSEQDFITRRTPGQLRINLNKFSDEGRKKLEQWIMKFNVTFDKSSDGILRIYHSDEDILQKISTHVAFLYSP